MTLGRICHTWINSSHLAKCVKPGKICHTGKNNSHLVKCVKPGKMCHTGKNVSHLENVLIVVKCDTLEKISHTW